MAAPRKHDREAVTAAICARLASGDPMTVICRDMGVAVKTVNDWRLTDEAIRAQFDEARDLGFDAIAAECMTIADTTQLGVIEKSELITDKDGYARMVVTERRNEDMLRHRKLQIETRLKLLAKWDPRRYGDALKLSGDPGAPLAGMTDAQVDERLAVLLAKREASA